MKFLNYQGKQAGFANGNKQIHAVLYQLPLKHVQITINFKFALCALDTQALQVYSEKIKKQETSEISFWN